MFKQCLRKSYKFQSFSKNNIHINIANRTFIKSSYGTASRFSITTSFLAVSSLVITTTALYQLKKSQPIILNDNNKNSLLAYPQGDTYEMELYLASQIEQKKALEDKRNQRLNLTKSKLKRLLLTIYFKVNDNLIEPIFTIYRFIEISVYILPLLLTFPITLLPLPNRQDHIWWYKLIKITLESLGPSFIKLGQWAASRTDLFPANFCQELGKLHSNVKPHSYNYTKDELCNLFQVETLDKVFEIVQEKPIGVGAIAQVHIVKFNDDFMKFTHGKQWFALKILHPNVGHKIEKDLKIMKFLASVINVIPTIEWLSLLDEVEQFSILMNMQLDLRIESLNLEKFRKNFSNYPQITFPTPLLKFNSTNILFEEYIDGLPMEVFLENKNNIKNVDLCKKISDPFVDAFLKMLILDDFIHSDLHPGNIIIKFVKMNSFRSKVLSTEDNLDVVSQLRELYKNDKKNFIKSLTEVLTEYIPQICFIDVGLVTELNNTDRVNFIDLFNALARFDGYRAGELMIERSRTPETAINNAEFANKVDVLVSNIKRQTFTLGTVSIGHLLDQMLSMVRSHHVRMEADFVSVVVSILLLEGIGRQLDPNLDLFDSSIPILREYAIRRDRTSLLKDAGTFTMLALWFGLELRQLMNSSNKQLNDLIKTDQLCPNY